MPSDNLLGELKRRRVFRALIAYAAAAFVVIQAADLIFPALELPGWAYKLVVVVALLGLPLVAVLAWVFDWRDGSVVRTQSPAQQTSPLARLSLIAGVAAVSAAAGWLLLRPDEERPLDANLIAVLPFRTAGGHADLSYLREGMLDLLATKINESPRVIDPRTTMSQWRRLGGSDDTDLPQDSAALVARALGAGRLVLGSVVGTPGRFTLSASLIDVGSGDQVASTSIEATADSLQHAVDRLAGALLSLSAGEAADRLATLSTASTAALRAYLAGKRHYRQGAYQAAAREFQRALREDSTFALAGIGLVEASSMGVDNGLLSLGSVGSRLANAHRDRLSSSDRAYLAVLTENEAEDGADRLRQLEQAAQQNPDRPEVHYLLGDYLLHFGPLTGIEDHATRAQPHLRKALELDPDFFVARQHLIWSAEMLGDTALIRRDGFELLARLEGGESAEFLRIELGTHVRPALLDSMRARLPTLSDAGLIAFIFAGIFPFMKPSVPDSRQALEIYKKRAANTASKAFAATLEHDIALIHGRLADADRARRTVAQLSDDPTLAARRALLDALYWDADSTSAKSHVDALLPVLAQPLSPDPMKRDRQLTDLCALEQWRLWRGEASTAAASIARLAAPAVAGQPLRVRSVCPLLLDALLAFVTRTADQRQRVQRLDSLLRRGPAGYDISAQANIAAARMLEAHGDLAAALAAYRRIPIVPGGQAYFTTRIREAGRLADRLGDREGAIRAYTTYLALRAEADPPLRHFNETIRARLAALTQR